MIILISALWVVIFTKKLFFWIYLWQLKEYHIGRFIDHFRTTKGKDLIFNFLLPVKILLFLAIFYSAKSGWAQIKFSLVYFVIVIFFVEALLCIKHFWKKTLKKPVFTQKTTLIFNTGISLAILILFFSFLLEFKLTRLLVGLLLIDILTPIIFSIIILVFQPFAVILRSSLMKRAKQKREKYKNLLVIGITGSYGKTSTKEFLAAILSEKYKVLKTKEHQNSEVGISRCVLNELGLEHEIFIVEMGAYSKRGIKLLCDIAKPRIGILTGINEQHMATFGSLENIIKAKYELIESLPDDGAAFFNGKNKHCRELYQKTKIKKYLYGENAGLGLENFEGAKLVAKELGVVSDKIVEKFPGFEVKGGINGLKIIDATYSANPTGVMMHLERLKTLPGKKIIIMPCLIELGKASKEAHQRIGRKIAEVCDLAIITTKDRFEEIQEAAPNALLIEKSEEIFEKIKSFCQPGDAVLLESRVPNQLMNLLIK